MSRVLEAVASVASEAWRDGARAWKSLAIADLAYKALAFALLAPATALLLRLIVPGGRERVLADTEILLFFVTTRRGVLALVTAAAFATAITALELACLMAIAAASSRGSVLAPRQALAFGAKRAAHALALAAHMVLRVLAASIPLLAVAGAAYWGLLTDHDINYYLAERPPAFWAAAAIVAVIALSLVGLALRAIARWAFALPIVLFENVPPRRALGESAVRSSGHRAAILSVLAIWAVSALALAALASWAPEAAGRLVAPHVAGSLPGLLAFVTGLFAAWAACALAAALVNVSALSLLLFRLYARATEALDPAGWSASRLVPAGGEIRMTPRLVAVAAGIALVGVVGVVLLAASTARRNQPVQVIAHRGASAAAPENSLAAFRLAVEQGTDWVELDVQESSDGEVLVVHDSDLMKIGGSPMKIWEHDAATLRTIDIGSRKGPQFAGERLPTLAEALAVCKGRARVIVELKSYGHDERLEERIAAIVERAGMQDDCIFMSLDHDMVRTMKRLRPSSRCGLLVAKAIGDLGAQESDFLAVEARMATRSFVRRMHRSGKEVYVWTVNDPAWMLAAMSRGVDGLITDKPDIARRVVERRAAMSDAQRVLVALLVRLGARTEALAAEDALRP